MVKSRKVTMSNWQQSPLEYRQVAYGRELWLHRHNETKL